MTTSISKTVPLVTEMQGWTSVLMTTLLPPRAVLVWLLMVLRVLPVMTVSMPTKLTVPAAVALSPGMGKTPVQKATAAMVAKVRKAAKKRLIIASSRRYSPPGMDAANARALAAGQPGRCGLGN